MKFLIVFSFPLLSLVIQPVQAEEIVMPVMKLTGSNSTEILNEDGIVQAREVKTGRLESGASSARTIGQKLALPTTDYGKVGTLSQVRGAGRGADEVNVESLGVPLNPPQGGGFDFTSFPSFFWSSYRFRLSPGVGAYDSHSNGGQISLQPWSAAAIDDETGPIRFQQVFNGAGVRQFSFGASRSGSWGVLAGYSDGRVKGPTGSVSGQILETERQQLRLHFLGTSVRAVSPGPVNFPSPYATTLFQRATPVLQSQSRLGDGQWSSTLYYDWSRIQYDNPATGSFQSNDRSRQYGIESAWKGGANKIGGGIKRAGLNRLDFESPREWSGHLGASHSIPVSDFSLTPEARAVGVSRMGILPAGSLSFGHREKRPVSLYSKLNYAPSFPTLNDRFYNAPRFYSNSALKPEKDLTALFGIAARTERWKFTAELYHQHRFEVLVQSGPSTRLTLINSDRAWIQSLRSRAEFSPLKWAEVTGGLSWTHSRLLSTGRDFPYQPKWLGVAAVAISPSQDLVKSKLEVSARTVSSQIVSSTGDRMAGYLVTDLSGSAKISEWGTLDDGKGLYLDIRVDNLFDRHFEAIRDFPSEGRILSVGLTGQL